MNAAGNLLPLIANTGSIVKGETPIRLALRNHLNHGTIF